MKVAATALLLLCLWEGLGHSQEKAASGSEVKELLSKVESSFNDMEYDRALVILNELEGREDLSKQERIEVLKYKAFIQIVVIPDREKEAFRVVDRLLDLEPGYTLSDSYPPTFREFFSKVKTYRELIKKGDVESREGAKTLRKELVTKTTAPPPARPGFLKKNLVPLVCAGVGVGLLVPGIVVGADAASYNNKLDEYKKDEKGRLIGISRNEAERMQEEGERKALTANILLGTGAAAIAGGVVTYFLLNMDSDTHVNAGVSGNAFYLTGSWDF